MTAHTRAAAKLRRPLGREWPRKEQEYGPWHRADYGRFARAAMYSLEHDAADRFSAYRHRRPKRPA